MLDSWCRENGKCGDRVAKLYSVVGTFQIGVNCVTERKTRIYVMILKRMSFLREQSMTKKSMTFQNTVSPHMGRGERVTRLHQQIAACGIETPDPPSGCAACRELHRQIAACGDLL